MMGVLGLVTKARVYASAGGGFASTMRGASPSAATSVAPPAMPQSQQAQTALSARPKTHFAIGPTFGDESAVQSQPNADIASGSDTGQKRLDAMTPAARLKLLRELKLAPALRAPKLPNVQNGRVTIQIWLNVPLASNAKLQAQLKALGFDVAASLRPNLVLGTLPVEKLDALLALRGVRFVESPQFKS